MWWFHAYNFYAKFKWKMTELSTAKCFNLISEKIYLLLITEDHIVSTMQEPHGTYHMMNTDTIGWKIYGRNRAGRRVWDRTGEGEANGKHTKHIEMMKTCQQKQMKMLETQKQNKTRLWLSLKMLLEMWGSKQLNRVIITHYCLQSTIY